MSVYSEFAENLRGKCAEYNTIAEVCDGIGINRQQFNKYLAGSSLPNALTLRRICSFFDIQEQSLFLSTPLQAGERRRAEETMKPFGHSSRSIISLAHLNYDFHVEALREGAYYCYFPMDNAPGMLVRSLLIVRRAGKKTSFIRLTVFPSSGKGARFLARGRHQGSVLANNTEIYFLGTNRYSPHQLSLMTIERANGSGNSFFTGVILTRSGTNLMNSRMCLMYVDGEKTARQMVGELGFLHESDTTIEPVVVAALRTK
jgi:transcriptional regulator with XRE-family HTH domain